MIRVGIIFGGASREREVSFAGGRTVFDSLEKSIFEAIPIFVDSFGSFIILEWQYLYKGTIRDFYPPTMYIPDEDKKFQIYIESIDEINDNQYENIIRSVGTPLQPADFKKHFDVAFLALHGPHGEDGSIQGILEWYNIPYTGCGVLPSAIGIDKISQKKWMQTAGFEVPKYECISRDEWMNGSKEEIYQKIIDKFGKNMVVKSPHQGSSIGITLLQNATLESFIDAVNKSLFIRLIDIEQWRNHSTEEKQKIVAEIADLKSGIGLPVYIGSQTISSPSKLLKYLETQHEDLIIEGKDSENFVLVEAYIDGEEFSCIVVQNTDGTPICLPPTQIVKKEAFFDYRSKYLPGLSRKITPIELPMPFIYRICEKAEALFVAMQCSVYARIDGFFANDGTIYLNDPNTTSGMLPSSFFFHQAAEIGLNPSQFLTYIIISSLKARLNTGKDMHNIKNVYENILSHIHDTDHNSEKIKIGVVMGGYSTERHISVESGRNIYEKLSSGGKYAPTPLFLAGSNGNTIYKIPVNIMLKDNADDIKEKIYSYRSGDTHQVIEEIRSKASSITQMLKVDSDFGIYKIAFADLPTLFDAIFIALHGRPGEDGDLQTKLDSLQLPYNGSGAVSSSITINKYATNELLMQHGINVAKHYLIEKTKWIENSSHVINEIEANIPYPIIAKPHDEGCSSAVKKITNRSELEAFATMIFRSDTPFPESEAHILQVKPNDEFPIKSCFLIEELISANGALKFMEVTGGVITSKNEAGEIIYEAFEPSETLATGAVLTLEEKFLAGEGQNITPARFSDNHNNQKIISAQVKKELANTAKILGVEGYCRIDAFVRIFENNRAETIVIEVNSLPGMTPATCIFHQAAINKYKPHEFIDHIIQYGMMKKSG